MKTDRPHLPCHAAAATGSARMDAHAVCERDQLLRSRCYADAVRRDPSLVAGARTAIARIVASGEETLGHLLWSRLLEEPMEFMLGSMISDGPEGRLLRSSNPFSTLVGSTNIAERRRTWRKARRELSLSAT